LQSESEYSSSSSSSVEQPKKKKKSKAKSAKKDDSDERDEAHDLVSDILSKSHHSQHQPSPHKSLDKAH
jgi:hypothetical protein